jgi:hypothetical protein
LSTRLLFPEIWCSWAKPLTQGPCDKEIDQEQSPSSLRQTAGTLHLCHRLFGVSHL